MAWAELWAIFRKFIGSPWACFYVNTPFRSLSEVPLHLLLRAAVDRRPAQPAADHRIARRIRHSSGQFSHPVQGCQMVYF
jgi:hypothetical protein